MGGDARADEALRAGAWVHRGLVLGEERGEGRVPVLCGSGSSFGSGGAAGDHRGGAWEWDGGASARGEPKPNRKSRTLVEHRLQSDPSLPAVARDDNRTAIVA